MEKKMCLFVLLMLIFSIHCLNIESFVKDTNTFSNSRKLQQIATSWDWSSKVNLTSVKSEGYCGASEAFATTAFYQTQAIIALNQTSTIDLSEQYLISCDPLNSNCSRRASVAELMDLVTLKGGIPSEAKVPYEPYNLKVNEICKTQEFSSVSKTFRKSFYNIGDQEILKKEVKKKPVIAVICGQELVNYKPGSTEDSKILRCSPRFSQPNQAVLIVGYTERYWIIRNSWGQKWGMKGYGFISRKSDENCCIEREIHTTRESKLTGAITGCQLFDGDGSCLKCQTGKYLQTILGSSGPSQACLNCSASNCQQCADFTGQCKYCIKGYGVNETTGNCQLWTIENCNKFVTPGFCNQCHKGFLLSSNHDNCFLNCPVENCAACESGQCDQCQAGFKLNTVNGTQICDKNTCSVNNCDLCDQNGTCVQCSFSYQLANTSQCTKPCSIADCLVCKSTDWYCSECSTGKSFNYATSVCESFTVTNCGMHLSGKCYECRPGYRFNEQRTGCLQSCDIQNCGQCKDKNPLNCLTCSDGYTSNTNGSRCEPNSCSIQNCTACKTDNSSCITCVTPYHIYNSTSNKCELKCSLENCQLCKPTDTVCAKCRIGYLPEYLTGKCIQADFKKCKLVAKNNQRLECWQCEPKHVANTENWQSCKMDCQDPLCEECDQDTLSICSRCMDGYHRVFSHQQNRLQCEQIPSLMPKCYFVSQNQTYCFSCHEYHTYNYRTLSCQPYIEDCPENCELCSPPGSLTPGCKCIDGYVYDVYQQKCVSNSFNSSCVQAMVYASQQICLKCEEEVLLASNYLSCMSKCAVPNCVGCYEGNNGFCEKCQIGYFVNSLWKCDPCNISGCKNCINSRQCTECQPGYELSLDGTVCRVRNCSFNNDQDGVKCSCNFGTDLTQSSVCQGCQENCRWCDINGCVECEKGYFLSTGSCSVCMPNCLRCRDSLTCDVCEVKFFFEPSQAKCVSVGSNSTYLINGQKVIQCPSGCLICQKSGICSECMQGYAISIVTQQRQCVPCERNCRSCLFNRPQVCLSCNRGFFLQDFSCQSCSDQNCLECRSSPLICTKCIQGFFPSNNTCKQCSKGCFECNFRGECTKCNQGFTLSSTKTCVKCVGNCSSCNYLQLTQCLTKCNQTSFLLNGSCNLCPQACTMCQASDSCLQCKSGYLLRDGNCVPPCSEGCYQCDIKNPQQCTKCFVGYKLSPSNNCQPDLTCNEMSNCTLCPKGFILLDNKCMISPQLNNCRQSSAFNLTQCIECEVGFYVRNKTCTQCNQSCKACSQQSLCSLCSDGFFLVPTENKYNGRCLKCVDMCKTCKDRATLCTSCHDGFQLTVDRRCLRKDKIEIKIKLDISMDTVYGMLQKIREDLAGFMGDSYKGQADLVQIVSLVSGSVIMDAQLNIPEKEDPNNIYQSVRSKLFNSPQIAGLDLMAVENIGLQTTSLPLTNQEARDDKKVLIIVLSTVIPIVGLAAIFASFYIYKKFFKNSAVKSLEIQDLQRKKSSKQLDAPISRTLQILGKNPLVSRRLDPIQADQILREHEDQKTFDIILRAQNQKISQQTNLSDANLIGHYSKLPRSPVISPEPSQKQKDSQIDKNEDYSKKEKTLKDMIVEDEAINHRQYVMQSNDRQNRNQQ